MLVGLRRTGRAGRDSWQEKLGPTLEFEKSRYSIILGMGVFDKDRCGEVRHLAIGMNGAPDFEKPELIEVARVIVDVLPEARKETGAQQILVRHDGVQDLHVRRQIRGKQLRR